jgi:hypothetical protein
MIRELVFSAQEAPAEAPVFFTAEQRVAANSYELTRGEGGNFNGQPGTSRKKLVVGMKVPEDSEDRVGSERRTKASGGEAEKKENILPEQQSSSVVEGRRLRSKK